MMNGPGWGRCSHYPDADMARGHNLRPPGEQVMNILDVKTQESLSRVLRKKSEDF